MNRNLKKALRWESFLVAFLIAEVLVFGAINPKMLNPRVLLGSINNFMPICVISLFVTFALITGGMDIQSGSIVGLTSICIGLMWQAGGVPIWAAAAMSLAVGALCGALSGFIIAYAGVQPMVVTLGGQFLYSGLAIAVSHLSATESYKGIGGFPASFTDFPKGQFFFVPNQFLLFLALTVVTFILLHRTKYGRRVFLVGVNPTAAEFSGIHSRRVIMSAYVLSGIGASIAGVLLTGYLGTSKADLGKELTLPIITAVVLGGTSNLGGKGSVAGTALAALVIGVLQFGLSMAGLSTQYFDVPIGLLLVVTVAGRSVMTSGDLRSLWSRLKNPKIMKGD
jgi:AI-2 transport system permease protein